MSLSVFRHLEFLKVRMTIFKFLQHSEPNCKTVPLYQYTNKCIVHCEVFLLLTLKNKTKNFSTIVFRTVKATIY